MIAWMRIGSRVNMLFVPFGRFFDCGAASTRKSSPVLCFVVVYEELGCPSLKHET